MSVWPNQVRFSRKLGFFRPFLRYTAKFCESFFNLFVAFMVLKTIVSISRFQRKNRFEKRTNLARDIFKNVLRLGEPNQTAGWKQFFIDISSNIGSFYKPIFALKPWDRAGHFEYHESYILSRKKMTKFGHLPQKWSKKPFCRKIWANDASDANDMISIDLAHFFV